MNRKLLIFAIGLLALMAIGVLQQPLAAAKPITRHPGIAPCPPTFLPVPASVRATAIPVMELPKTSTPVIRISPQNAEAGADQSTTSVVSGAYGTVTLSNFQMSPSSGIWAGLAVVTSDWNQAAEIGLSAGVFPFPYNGQPFIYVTVWQDGPSNAVTYNTGIPVPFGGAVSVAVGYSGDGGWDFWSFYYYDTQYGWSVIGPSPVLMPGFDCGDQMWASFESFSYTTTSSGIAAMWSNVHWQQLWWNWNDINFDSEWTNFVNVYPNISGDLFWAT